VLALLLAALGFERVQSLREPQTAWADAAAKIDLKAAANAVGRWRPFLNMGSAQLERDENQEALRLFSLAAQLGEPLGSARFNMAMAYTQLKQPAQALAQLQQAEAMGFQGGALYFQRGELQYAQGQFAAAMQSYTQALDKPQPASEQELSRRRHAEAAVAARIRPRHRRLPGAAAAKARQHPQPGRPGHGLYRQERGPQGHRDPEPADRQAPHRPGLLRARPGPALPGTEYRLDIALRAEPQPDLPGPEGRVGAGKTPPKK
jgi:tetratricopeptide (TPR) repeat protein